MLNSVEAIVQIKKKLQNPQDWIQGKSWGFYFFGIGYFISVIYSLNDFIVIYL